MVRLHTVARKRLQKSSGVPFQDGHASTQAKTASPVTLTFESFSFGSRQFEFLIFVHSDMYVCQLPTAIPQRELEKVAWVAITCKLIEFFLRGKEQFFLMESPISASLWGCLWLVAVCLQGWKRDSGKFSVTAP